MSSGTHGQKRLDTDPLADVQSRNRDWWDTTPMNYDWHGVGRAQAGSLAWYEDQDRRFIETCRHFATDRVPFDRLIPLAELRGKRVLEIGIGSGFHSELLARAGAEVTGIDITRSAVERTTRRFELKSLAGRFEQADAEQARPEFARAFDYVWSWGVIHHSSRTALIVRNIHEWLRVDGTFAGMVYHRDSTTVAIALLRDWIFRRNLLAHSVDEALWRSTDGYTARFYPAEQWRDLLLAFFQEANVGITGMLPDAVPLPRQVRGLVARRLSPTLRDRVLARVGSLVTFSAARPR